MAGRTEAVDDATAEPSRKNAAIAPRESEQDSTPLLAAGTRGRSNYSSLAPANVRPVVSGEPGLRGSFSRVLVDGKFLSADGEPFFVRGVTYGAFRPDEAGHEYTNDWPIERDFAQMAAFGINTVRIPHTVPPRSLLDIAAKHGLRVMVGLSAEQSAGHLIDRNLPSDFVARFRAKVCLCAGHPALLCVESGRWTACCVSPSSPWCVVKFVNVWSRRQPGGREP